MEADKLGQIMLIYIEKVLTAKWTKKVFKAKSKKCVWWTLDPPMPEHIICLLYTYDYKDNTTSDYNIASVMVYSSQHIK